MKIALYVHCFFPDHFYGTETYTLELVTNLRAMGHEAVVVSAVFPGEARRNAAITRYEYKDIPVYCIDRNYLPHRNLGDTYYQAALHEVHQRLLTEIKPDIVHVTHLINHTAVLLDAAAELNIPVVSTLTDFFGFCFNNRLEAADGSLCRGPNRERTNCIACVLKAKSDNRGASAITKLIGKHPWSLLLARVMAQASRMPYVLSRERVTFITSIQRRPDILAARYAGYRAAIAPTRFLRDAYAANGLNVPLHLMHFGVDFPRTRKEPCPAGAPIRLGYIGQIAAHKGVDVLIDAFARLPAGRAELVVYGSADQVPEYMALLVGKARGHGVSFPGTFPKERLADILYGLDFLVIPSRWYENSPLVLLNAMASHTPVVVSDVDGMTEFVKDGENGFLFQRGSVEDLERVLKKIVQNPEMSRRMSDNTEYHRTTRIMTEEVVAIYKSVLS
jgi:glycosyltransferase involved in cell wall biosynthesis